MFVAMCHGSQRKLIWPLISFIQVKCIFLMHLREVHKSISFLSFFYVERKVKKWTPPCRLWGKSGLFSVVGNRPQSQWTISVWNPNVWFVQNWTNWSWTQRNNLPVTYFLFVSCAGITRESEGWNGLHILYLVKSSRFKWNTNDTWYSISD